jgi:hypothetical protein
MTQYIQVIFLGRLKLSVKEKRGRKTKGKIVEVRFKDEMGNLALLEFNRADPMLYLRDTKYVPVLESLKKDILPQDEGPYSQGRRELMDINHASYDLPDLIKEEPGKVVFDIGHDVETKEAKVPDKEVLVKNTLMRLSYLMQVVHPRLVSEVRPVDETTEKMLIRDVSSHRESHSSMQFFYDKDRHLTDSITTDVMTVGAMLDKARIELEGVEGRYRHALHVEEMVQFIPGVLRADGSNAFFARILGENAEGTPLNWMGGVLFVDDAEVITYMVPFSTARLPPAVYGFDIYSDSALMSDLAIQAGCNSLDINWASIGEALERGENPDELIEKTISQAKHFATLAAKYYNGESVKDFEKAIEDREKHINEGRREHEEIVFLNEFTDEVEELNHQLKSKGGKFGKKRLWGLAGYSEGMNPDEYTGVMLGIIDKFLAGIEEFGAKSQRLQAAAQQLGTIIEIFLPNCEIPEEHRMALVSAMSQIDWAFKQAK